nr:MAG TPA: minor capsid component [Caudoviricetes sp.]
MILLQNGFDLPEIKERNLKGRKKGTGNLGEYHPDSKIIYINNHPIIKEMGGLRKIMQNEVVKGRAVQDNVVLHELAHYIDQIINPGFDSPQHSYRVFLNREYVKEQLSEYAYTNRSEFEAELISGILRGKVYPKEILDYADISKLDNEKAKHILALGNGTIPNDSGLPREFDKMTETVYKNPEKDAAVLLTDSDVRKFIERQKLIFDNAVDTSLKEVPLDDISVQRLKESNYVFSGIKTFHELNEAFPSLLDEEGNRKPFNQFLNDVQKVYDTYNVQYLRTEYNFAQASALMAARWKQFEQDGDRYYLQYRTVGDKRVRRTHRMLHNITLPITSPFWEKYFPPNGWNCRCTVVQVRKDKYPVSNEQEAMNLGSQATAGKYQEMFMFNPGKRMTTFPAYNGYTLRKCNRCEVRPDKMKLAADIPDNEVCRACRLLQESRLAGIHSATEGIRNIIRRLGNGYPKGDAVRIGRLTDDVKEFVRKKGIEPLTDEIYMADKQIHHALRSVKQKAGKAVTAEQLAALPSLMDDCEVYWDEKAGNIQFITRQDGKVQKFVVSLNYTAKIQGEKKTVNAFITAGILEERNLRMKNLIKIK